ncbi:hypothetical protein [Roseateles amylovorans]|uniref:Lipoprotein n=1 Tax=Roseateles amylovorans TaxID=2978473 RepID=A0ABY6B159_9BURK|nr:hypothetical protein [Roseateles amylovorans]UXH77931.1 hypothetical protein N4261_23715 [Roseateles amylovorans]
MGLTACSPALNWREISPDGAALQLMFPCKPDREERQQPGPGGRSLSLHTLSCEARGWQFSLTWTDLGDPSAVPPALRRMTEGLAQQLSSQASAPLALRGMTPDPSSRQQTLVARPGQPAQVVRQAVFARGGRVYQLLMQGRQAGAGVTGLPASGAGGYVQSGESGPSGQSAKTSAGKGVASEADEAWDVWLGSIRLPG